MGFLVPLITTSIMIFILGIFVCAQITVGHPIGVCYGRIADNLPSEQDVINFYKYNKITRMRIYDPDQATLQALKGTNIELVLGIPNANIQELADPSTAMSWVQTNVVAYSPEVKFRYISVGNEVTADDPVAKFVLPAIQNVYKALASANLQTLIKVSTSIAQSLLGASYPPSAGSFSDDAVPYIAPIIQTLSRNRAPLLVNVYTYFTYVSNVKDVSLDYALFTSQGVVVEDGEFRYRNLFDASLDAVYYAVERLGGANVEIVVSESGWPSYGGLAATVENANSYYKHLINHVRDGTPKKPGHPIEVYLFAMFDEYQKGPAETERHFGLFSPSKQAKYDIKFS